MLRSNPTFIKIVFVQFVELDTNYEKILEKCDLTDFISLRLVLDISESATEQPIRVFDDKTTIEFFHNSRLVR